MKFSSYLNPDYIFPCLEVNSKEEIIRKVVDKVAEDNKMVSEQKNEIIKNILKREEEISTCIGNGIFLPHTRMKDFSDFIIAVATIKNKLEGEIGGTNQIDDIKVVFLIISDVLKNKNLLKAMSAISKIALKNPEIIENIKKATHSRQILESLSTNDIEIEHKIIAEDVLSPEIKPARENDTLEEIAKTERPKLIVAGASAYSHIIDFSKFREIADAVGAKLMVDMAHIAGLVAAGLHPNPVPYAHITTTTTHKTLRGPRGGLILTNDEELAKKINSAIFPGIQGGPLEHVVAAKAVSFKEVLDPAFKEYAANVIKNSKAMADVFLQDPDFRIISGGTENHLFLVDVTKVVENGKVAQNLLDEVNITLNKNSIPYETLSPFKTSGIRIGAAAITARGFGEEESRKVAELIIKTLKNAENEAVLEEVRSAVKELTDAFPLYED